MTYVLILMKLERVNDWDPEAELYVFIYFLIGCIPPLHQAQLISVDWKPGSSPIDPSSPALSLAQLRVQ